ncbi:MAG: alanine racemase [Lachnospiraceae bacterium]
MYSRVYAAVDLDAVRYNMEKMRECTAPDAKLMAVVKTDGYGHGAVPIAKEIQDLPYLFGFAVATVEEAAILIRHGIEKPILVLGIPFEEQYETMVKYSIRPAVSSLEEAEALNDCAKNCQKKLPIHIAIDTGMSRIGFQVTTKDADVIKEISALPYLEIEGMFTHFARADEADKTAAAHQYEKFQQMLAFLNERGVTIPYPHCSNSASIVDLPEYHMSIVRAGITLYGLWPSDEVQKERLPIRPVLSLYSQVAYIKDLEAGREIGYGGTYTTPSTRRIATIPVGYGDGYPRSLSNKGYVLIHGEKAPIRGRVCMDQFMVDVTEIPDVKVGDRVTLIGTDKNAHITMEEAGELSGRFNYEFACDLGKRIPRVFYKNNQIIGTHDSFME